MNKLFKLVMPASERRQECQLLCEADELCQRSALIKKFECKVFGLPSALGAASPENSQQAAYELRSPSSASGALNASLGALAEHSGTGKSSLRRVLLATYASGKVFEETQQKLHESLERAEIAEHWAWNQSMFENPSGPSSVHAEWYRQHESVNFRRGGAWKPYIIWQALRRVQWGDWLVFQLHCLSTVVVHFGSNHNRLHVLKASRLLLCLFKRQYMFIDCYLVSLPQITGGKDLC